MKMDEDDLAHLRGLWLDCEIERLKAVLEGRGTKAQILAERAELLDRLHRDACGTAIARESVR